jgi:hypothetical protein
MNFKQGYNNRFNIEGFNNDKDFREDKNLYFRLIDFKRKQETSVAIKIVKKEYNKKVVMNKLTRSEYVIVIKLYLLAKLLTTFYYIQNQS